MGEKDPNAKDPEQARGYRRLSSVYHGRVVREIPKLLWYGTLLQGEPIIVPWRSSERDVSSTSEQVPVSKIEN